MPSNFCPPCPVSMPGICDVDCEVAKEDVLYCQLHVVYLGKWELLSGLTMGIYRNRGSLESKPVLSVVP